MNTTLLQEIDARIEACEEALIRDTIRLIRIPSIKGEVREGAPFGEGPRKVLDTVLEWGREVGFVTAEYGHGIISLSPKKGEIDLGIWAHGDVAEAGEGWQFPPFEGILYEGCVIGRGATDNKGQLVAVFHLLRIFKELGISLSYNPALYVGSNEESGMADLKGFLKEHTPPRLSLVPDGGFPMGYGATGLVSFYLESKTPLQDFTLTTGGPDRRGAADADFHTKALPAAIDGATVEGQRVSVFCPPRHSAHPDPEDNSVTKITTALLATDLLCESDREILTRFRTLARDITGATFGFGKGNLPPIKTCALSIRDNGGCPVLELRTRYPVSLAFETVESAMGRWAEEHGFTLSAKEAHRPYENPSDTPVVTALTEVANEVIGTDAPPYINGATYAHHLPCAYIYGMNGCLPPETFPKGRGGAHGLDECVSIQRLMRAMRIYARALLKLEEIPW